MFFDFVQTETGWRLFWGPDPKAEKRVEQSATDAVRAGKTADAPVLITAEAEALHVMAV